MSLNESALLIPCDGEQLCGVLHHGKATARQGVLILVGGPQYRVGSHRSFVLLARCLAAAGIPVLRFDYRGMGDSSGDFPGFEHVEADISAALDIFFAQHPSLEGVVLWGLCDGAAAAALYASKDARISGMVLVNPWVRTEAGLARTQLQDYYNRFFSRAFWGKLLRFRLDLKDAFLGVFRSLLSASGAPKASAGPSSELLPDRMLASLSQFSGTTLLILCDEDMTAQEFTITLNGSRAWQAWAAQASVELQRVAEADHTFSSAVWRNQLNQLTKAWMLRR